MGLDRHRGRGVKTAPPYTGWIAKADYEGPGSTIRWGSWDSRKQREDDVPLTLFPYSSGNTDVDRDLVAESNYAILSADTNLMKRCVLIEGGYGTYGIAYVFQPTKLIREYLAALDSYPLLDDYDHSERERTNEEEQWEDWGRKEFAEALLEHVNQTNLELAEKRTEADEVEWQGWDELPLTDKQISGAYWDACSRDRTHCYPESCGNGDVNFQIAKAVKAVDLEALGLLHFGIESEFAQLLETSLQLMSRWELLVVRPLDKR